MDQHGKHRALVAAAAVLSLAAHDAAAQDCRLALVLAMDVSSSVDAREDALQREGLAAALLAPDVARAVFSGDLPVALSIFQWSGRYSQAVLLDWTLLAEPADLERAAGALRASRRIDGGYPTAIGYALGVAAVSLRDGPACLFRTIDVAGDGVNNEGFPPSSAYRAFPFEGVTVNGLVVGSGVEAEDTRLADYYAHEVLHGPGAFLEIADGFEDYERAMRRKLVRELSPVAVGTAPDNRPGAPG